MFKLLIEQHQSACAHAESEINGYRKQVRDLLAEIEAVHGDRQRIVAAIKQAQEQHLEGVEGVKAYQAQMDDLGQ